MIQEITERSSLEDTYSAMEELSGIAIPVEEKTGGKEAVNSAGVKPKAKLPVGGSEGDRAVNWQNNSVASLLASRLVSEGDSDL